MNEHILIRMGLDQRGVSSGLQSVSQQMNSWAARQGSQIGRLFMRGMGRLSLAGAAIGLRNASEEINRMKDDTEALEARFGTLNEAIIESASSVGEASRKISQFFNNLGATIVATGTTMFEVIATKLRNPNQSLDDILNDIAEQSVKTSIERRSAAAQKHLDALIARYRTLKKEFDFNQLDTGEKIKALHKLRAANLDLIDDENTAAERQVELATQNLEIRKQLIKLYEQHTKEGRPDLQPPPLPEMPPVRADPLREELAKRFGDPFQAGYGTGENAHAGTSERHRQLMENLRNRFQNPRGVYPDGGPLDADPTEVLSEIRDQLTTGVLTVQPRD